MPYKKVTSQIVDLIESSESILSDITDFSTAILNNKAWERQCKINSDFSKWYNKVKLTLEKNELKLEALKIENIYNNNAGTKIEDKFYRMKAEELKFRLITQVSQLKNRPINIC